MFIIENDGTITTERDIKGFEFDPKVGSGFTMTAHGPVKTDVVKGFMRDEARRLATMTPSEPEFA